MALEEKVAALTDEIQKLTSITAELLKIRTEAIETVRGAAAPAEKPAAAAKTTAPKAAAAATPAEPPKTEAPAAAVATGEDDEVEVMKKTVGAYVGETDDKDERAARKAQVKEVLDTKLGGVTVAEIPAAKRKAFLKKIAELAAEVAANGWLTKRGAAAEEVEDEL